MATRVVFHNIQEEIVKYLKSAEIEVDIAVAWITDKAILNLIGKLLKKGVRVKILYYYDDDKNEYSQDIFQILYTYGAQIRFRCSDSKNLMHNKFCIIDDEIVINGSYNWTNNAKYNDENIQITTGNPELVNSFKEEFDRLFDLYEDSERNFKTQEELLQEYIDKQKTPSKYPCFLKCEQHYNRNQSNNLYVFILNANDLYQYYCDEFLHKPHYKTIYDNVYGIVEDDKNGDYFIYFQYDKSSIVVESEQCIFQINKREEVISRKIKYNERLTYGCYKIVENGKCCIYDQYFKCFEMPQYFIPTWAKRTDDLIIMSNYSRSHFEVLLYKDKCIICNKINIEADHIIECIEYPIFERSTENYLGSSITWENLKIPKNKTARISRYEILFNTLRKISDNKNENFIYLSDEDLWKDAYEACEKKCNFPISYKAFENTKHEFRNKMNSNQSTIDEFIKKLKENDSAIRAELDKRIPYEETPEYKRKEQDKKSQYWIIGGVLSFLIFIGTIIYYYWLLLLIIAVVVGFIWLILRKS